MREEDSMKAICCCEADSSTCMGSVHRIMSLDL